MFEQHPRTRPAPRAALRCVVAGLALLLPVLVQAPIASADYHVPVCSDLTTGAASNASGWSTSQSGSYVGASLCSGGGYMSAVLLAGVSHNYTDNATLAFGAPANTTIAAFSLWRWDQAGASQPYGTPINTFNINGNTIDACAQSTGCSSEGSTTSPSGSVIGASGLSATQITAIAACGGGAGGVCPSSSTNTEIRIYGGDIQLHQSAPPVAGPVSGSLVTSAAHSGTQGISYSASDNGGGVYAATLMLDGKSVKSSVLSTNSGHCVPTRQNADGSLVFNDVVPCPTSSTSGAMTFDTATLSDGAHQLQLVISDAAGNTTVAYDGQITTQNAPTAGGVPTISGTPVEGQQLTGTDTTFTSQQSAGTAQITTAWLRCDSQGNNCQPIAGANTASYTLTAQDVGATMRYRDTATNNDGSTSAQSAATPVVTAPGGSGGGGPGGGGSGGSGGGGGGQTGSGGAPGQNGASGQNGATGSTASLPGLTITITPGAGAGGPLMGSADQWRVSLAISPSHVHRHTLVTLSGRVTTSPRPGSGKLILLQARPLTAAWRGSGRHRHRVTVYGSWVTFNALRAQSSGQFKATYRFRLGGRRRYQFQALAPKEGGWQNPTGSSKSVTVIET
jgi:hypothetical protein